MHNNNRQTLLVSSAVIAFLGSHSALCADVNITGFGTIGYAISDQPFKYLRYIDDRGTFKVDSLAGVQTEIQFNSQWGATVQGVASAPRTRDNGYEAKIRWAFLSFRPDNEWLLRAGRVRPPVFFNTQNAEVGVTYDVARLPPEVYSLSPVYDFDGAAVTRTWTLGSSELNLDVYSGNSDLKLRLFQRDANQARFVPARATVTGIGLSHNSNTLSVRGSAHKAKAKFGATHPAETLLPATPFSPTPPPLGGTLYVPFNLLSEINLTVLTLGADAYLGSWRITAEFGQRIVTDTDLGLDSKSGYVTITRKFGGWSPYATYARLLSGSDTRNVYRAVNPAPVPLLAQGAPLFLPPNYHRILVDQGFVFDQYSTMLGASYSFSATSKWKLEWMRTKVDLASSLVDGDVHNKHFNVFSVSYSFTF